MVAETPFVDADRLIALLTEQRNLYARLRELSRQQRVLVGGDRPEKLLTILRERQQFVVELARLNEELGPFRRQWDPMYAALPPERRKQATALLAEINGHLREILDADREDSALLSARKEAVAADLSGLAGGRAAGAAYTPRVVESLGADVHG